MRAQLKQLDLDPDPTALSGNAAEFALLAHILVGLSDGPGEESFDLVVCTPEWLAAACRRAGGIYDARHHLVVNLENFDRDVLQAWLTARVQEAEADTWQGLAERLSRLGYWEFEEH